MARHSAADRAPPLLAAGSEGTHGRTALVCAGERSGHARPPAPRMRYSNGSQSMVRLPGYSQGTGRGTRGVLRGMCVERSARGSGKGPCAALGTGTRRPRAREGVLRTVSSTPRRWANAGGCCKHAHGHVRRGHAHGSATVRARARRGAYGHQRAGGRTHAHGAAWRARVGRTGNSAC